MSLKTLKGKMQDGLAARLARFGFSAGDQRFRREAGGATQIVHLSFIEDNARAVLSTVVNLAVRHDRIETLVNSWRDDLSAKDKKRTATLGVELGRLLGRGQRRWQVTSEEECSEATRDVFGLISEHGLPYLELHSDLANVRARLSSPDPNQWHQLAGGRALRLPVVHALLGDGAAARREFRAQLEYLRETGDLLAGAYPSFVDFASGELNLSGAAGGGDGEVR